MFESLQGRAKSDPAQAGFEVHYEYPAIWDKRSPDGMVLQYNELKPDWPAIAGVFGAGLLMGVWAALSVPLFGAQPVLGSAGPYLVWPTLVLALGALGLGLTYSVGVVRAEIEVDATGIRRGDERWYWADVGDLHWDRAHRGIVAETGSGGHRIGGKTKKKMANQLIAVIEPLRPSATGPLDAEALRAMEALRDRA